MVSGRAPQGAATRRQTVGDRAWPHIVGPNVQARASLIAGTGPLSVCSCPRPEELLAELAADRGT